MGFDVVYMVMIVATVALVGLVVVLVGRENRRMRAQQAHGDRVIAGLYGRTTESRLSTRSARATRWSGWPVHGWCESCGAAPAVAAVQVVSDERGRAPVFAVCSGCLPASGTPRVTVTVLAHKNSDPSGSTAPTAPIRVGQHAMATRNQPPALAGESAGPASGTTTQKGSGHDAR